jgi:hypothetical protein
MLVMMRMMMTRSCTRTTRRHHRKGRRKQTEKAQFHYALQLHYALQRVVTAMLAVVVCRLLWGSAPFDRSMWRQKGLANARERSCAAIKLTVNLFGY